MYPLYTPALQTLFLVSAVVIVNGNRLRTPVPPQLSANSEEDFDVTELNDFSFRWDNIQLGRTRGRLEDYKSEIESKMRGVETPEDYLQIFFPNGNMDTIWNDIVNSSMNQGARGRNQGSDKAMKGLVREEDYSDDMSGDIRDGLTEHMREMSCNRPKSVLVDMYDELNISRSRPFYIVPECTTLMRCHNGDCCSRVKPCVPREGTRENITRSFLITEIKLYSKNEVLEPSPSIRLLNYTFQQDTICDCLGPPRQPTCDLTCTDINKKLNERYCQCECKKKCPRPYTQDEDTCMCDCDGIDGDCKKVKRGKRTMKETDCNCVSGGKCYSPPCKKGYVFSQQLCRCDIKRKQGGSKNSRRRIGQTSSNNPPRGRFGGGASTESISSGGHSGCVTEAPTQTVDKNSNVNESKGNQTVSLAAKPRDRLGLRNSDVNARTDSSCEEMSSDNGQESDEDKEESSGHAPQL